MAHEPSTTSFADESTVVEELTVAVERYGVVTGREYPAELDEVLILGGRQWGQRFGLRWLYANNIHG